jgi:putative ABC transport system ATP-binding protein
MNESLISVQQLRKVYRVGSVQVEALRGVDLEIQRGEFVAVVGPSGSGKSTLFHILGGLTPPTAGAVRMAGNDLVALTDAGRTRLRRQLVGFVFQKFNLLPTLSAGDNIRLARYLGGNSSVAGAADGEFQRLLEALGILGRLAHKPAQLSGGEQQRVAITRALVNRPAILLADEPTGNLDSANSEAVLKILRDLNRELGQTILMITHNAEAAAGAQRTLHMRDGRIEPPVPAEAGGGSVPAF